VASIKNPCFVTSTAQFTTLSGADYLAGCDFRLNGLITLVDTNRDLVVLQDATGAVALNFKITDAKLEPGQLVTLDGTNCCPYFASFPDYPYRPSGMDVRPSFEAPSYWGHYYLTRMRGWLRPPVTGQYSFWIASDNSSELRLSPDADPSKQRKIASIPRFDWVNEHEWSHFPSQHSETILLKGGESYYIEALQEQTTGGDHLSVAWQGPGIKQSVIEGRFLTPCNDVRGLADGITNGILREFWTNFSAGDLAGVGGPRPFNSALSTKAVRVTIHRLSPFPIPGRLAFDQPLRPEDNYRWVEMEGVVKFAAETGVDTALLDLSDGKSLAQVRVHCSLGSLKQVCNSRIRVEGVCEGVYDPKGSLAPGLIWTPSTNCISVAEWKTNSAAASVTASATGSTAQPSGTWQGFYSTRCIVTFNDRVLGNDYVFVQEDSAPMLVAFDERGLKEHLTVGHWVDLAGSIQRGKYLPVLTPLVVTELGAHCAPLPSAHPLSFPLAENQEGRWSELEGVVHKANTNGTLSVVGKDWRGYFWVGQTPTNRLARYVDATLRARGVLSLSLLDAPVLLIPSRDYLGVEEDAPDEPFRRPKHAIADVLSEAANASLPHRVRVAGAVTYCEPHSFFIQDNSAGIRVRTTELPQVEVGQTVEVAGFPTSEGLECQLTEAVARQDRRGEAVSSKVLELGEPLFSKQSGTLVHMTATLLGQTTNGIGQRLELQHQQRLFAATLAGSLGHLPEIIPGSRIALTGVLANETTPEISEKSARAQFLASLNILLRSPDDVAVLSGPPWWTWKRTASLVGTLLTVVVVALLWVHLLRRRLERQQAAQLVFSRNLLERLEEERRRIAANLHDSLGQLLLVIKSQAIWATQGAPEEPGWRERLEGIGDATSQAIEEVRRITRGLRPYQLDRLGLTQAVRTLVARASENSSIVFASRVEDIDNLFEKDNEIHVYRIIQEDVNNIVKHSGATEATVVIKRRAAGISLSLRDNGRGFDATKLSAQPHDLGYGLSGIAERVRILGGTLVIDSRPGQGTSTTVEIPLPNSNNGTGTNSSNR
jgi:signal transduction histidine kinase